jgi:hypothetical protein
MPYTINPHTSTHSLTHSHTHTPRHAQQLQERRAAPRVLQRREPGRVPLRLLQEKLLRLRAAIEFEVYHVSE